MVTACTLPVTVSHVVSVSRLSGFRVPTLSTYRLLYELDVYNRDVCETKPVLASASGVNVRQVTECGRVCRT